MTIEELEKVQPTIDELDLILSKTKSRSDTILKECSSIRHGVRGKRLNRKWFVIILFFILWTAGGYVYPKFKTDILLILTVFGILLFVIRFLSERAIKKYELMKFSEMYNKYKDDFTVEIGEINTILDKLDNIAPELAINMYVKESFDYIKDQMKEGTSFDDATRNFEFSPAATLDPSDKILLLQSEEKDSEKSESIVLQLILSNTTLTKTEIIEHSNQ